MKASGVLVGALLLSACSGGAPDLSARGDADVPVPPGLESGCPPENTPPRYPDGDLPSGAVAVRLCPGAPTIAYTGARVGPHVQPPLDELTTDVARVLDVVNGLPEFEAGNGCPLDAGAKLVYWFRYPGGDARAVGYHEGGCHTLTVGPDRDYSNGERVATAFADALLAQRTHAEARPPAGTDHPSCPVPAMTTPRSVLPSVPLAMTQATWCKGVAPGRGREAAIPAPLLRRLNEALLGAPTEQRYRCDPPIYWQSIEGVNTWDDRVSYQVAGCHVVARTGYGRDNITTTYKADPDVLAAIAALPQGPVQRWDRES